jgi:hypothetical protein
MSFTFLKTLYGGDIALKPLQKDRAISFSHGCRDTDTNDAVQNSIHFFQETIQPD